MQVNKMLRRLDNILHLRMLKINEIVGIQDAIALLTDLHSSTAVNLYYNFANLRRRKLKNLSPIDIAEFIYSEIGISPGQQMTHQVYTGVKIEKHYIDLEERVGRGIVGEMTFIVKIDYKIKKLSKKISDYLDLVAQ